MVILIQENVWQYSSNSCQILLQKTFCIMFQKGCKSIYPHKPAMIIRLRVITHAFNTTVLYYYITLLQVGVNSILIPFNSESKPNSNLTFS